jgi:hypothetical protein
MQECLPRVVGLHRPVSKVWITDALRGQTATLQRLAVDRQLDEALTHGPDPLHLAAVFGLVDKTAIPLRGGRPADPRDRRAETYHHEP